MNFYFFNYKLILDHYIFIIILDFRGDFWDLIKQYNQNDL